VIALGGGVLIAALAFVRAPEGNAFIKDPLIAVAGFAVGMLGMALGA